MVELRSTGKEVGYYRVKKTVYDMERDLIMIFDPQHSRRVERSLEKRIAKRVEKVHDYFEDKLNQKKWRDPERVKEKIKTILGARLYESLVKVRVEGDPGDLKIRLDIDEEMKKRRIETKSKSILYTN
jgi:hypothetical protein